MRYRLSIYKFKRPFPNSWNDFVHHALVAHTGTHFGEAKMDWNRVEGNWKQMKGKIKEQWGKLTDDDLDSIEGQREQLEGKIQARYGYARDQVSREVDDWYNSQRW
jgi:uncharacterized protein YjbJ (UPF0337 family)